MADNQERKILLVEDEAIVALHEQKTLEKYGSRVVSVTC
jgi:CheY-like chemotaxis protein